jgi:hypothetical protein
LRNGTIVLGVHSPLSPPTRAFESAINFSETLTPQSGGLIEGVGMRHDCCIHTHFISHPPTVIHEFLHTIEGEQIGDFPVPFVDDDKFYDYPGHENDSSDNNWENWYSAVLRGTVGPRRLVSR